MKVRFCRYIIDLYDNIPEGLYWLFLGVLCVGCLYSFIVYGLNRGLKLSSRLLLTEHVVLIYLITVFFREELSVQKFKLMPLWSYRIYLKEGEMYMLIENIMNILVFIPIGVLLGLSFEKICLKTVFLTGMILSLSVEVMQFVTVRGLAEFDDLMHNTIGCILGYGVFFLFKMVYEDLSKKSVEV